MKIHLWSVGRTHEDYVKTGVEEFTRRLGNYFPATWSILSPPKNASSLERTALLQKEAEIILGRLRPDDCLVSLDEKGKTLSSADLSIFIDSRANERVKSLIFLIGGAYGLDPNVLKRSLLVWSLSKLTFPHQLVRLILAEQLYRACTILRNEKYHHGG
jgi:23S rRNA (pseudouridine1915-N3)-methyltransferase